jgi:3-deoxy-7-phosphoheptulonate synthase
MKIIKLQASANIKRVQGRLHELGVWTVVYEGDADAPAQLLTKPYSATVSDDAIRQIEGVAQVWSQQDKTPKIKQMPATLTISGVSIGGEASPVLMAGPCSVEGEEHIHTAAAMVAAAGAHVLRGGCFKPRTSPYSFQGVGAEGLAWMEAAARAHNLLTVTEAMAPNQVEIVARHIDIFQIGARNMQNFELLHAVGRANKPVLLKRGLSATISEWLQAGEHLMSSGASEVIFCERGIRSFDDSTRFLLDLGAVALLRDVHKVPVIVDPSHAAGRKDLIPRLGHAALVAGASGLIVEAHPDPSIACSDAAQQLNQHELHRACSLWGFPNRPVQLSQAG